MLGEKLCSETDIDIMSWVMTGYKQRTRKCPMSMPNPNVQGPMSETRNTNLVCHIRGACIAYMDLVIRRHESVHPEEGEQDQNQGSGEDSG